MRTLGKRVYIAGPYSGGDTAANVSKAMDIWHWLRDLGYSPYVPHLSHFLHIHRQRDYQDWLDIDMDWLVASEWVYRFSGESSGADKETLQAIRLLLPVVFEGEWIQPYEPAEATVV